MIEATSCENVYKRQSISFLYNYAGKEVLFTQGSGCVNIDRKDVYDIYLKVRRSGKKQCQEVFRNEVSVLRERQYPGH